jgi:hypothetical protein
MRTKKSSVTFKAPFTLNKTIGELPAGTYEIEVDEEEIIGIEATAYRRTQTLLFVQQPGSTRSLAVDNQSWEAALRRDAEQG